MALIVRYNSYQHKSSYSYNLYGKTKDAYKVKYYVTLEYGLDEYTLNLVKDNFSKISLNYSSDSAVYIENDFIKFMSEHRFRVIHIDKYIN